MMGGVGGAYPICSGGVSAEFTRADVDTRLGIHGEEGYEKKRRERHWKGK